MGWSLESLEPRVWVGIGAGAVLLAFLLILLIRRHRKSKKLGTEESLDLQLTFGAYRESHPSFFRVMLSFQEKHQLKELLAKGEVRAAVKLLETQRRGRKGGRKRGKAKASLLELSVFGEPEDNRRVQAAMLTILRAIYQDESLRQDLSGGADKELDRLLESLTG